MKTIIQYTGKKQIVLLCTIMVMVFIFSCCTSNTGESIIKQKPLPYPEDALEPYISAKTMNLHYAKHYAAYVTETKKLLKKTPFKSKNHIEIIRLSFKKKRYKSLFNNAAQAWNHEFFWESLSPNSGGKPGEKLALKIDASFGSYKAFQDEFILAAKQLFGSGWVWLVLDKRQLKIVTTCNADTPIIHGQRPLFNVDVWEHAYYTDYQNKRRDYVKAVLENIVNWDRIETLIGEDS